MSAPIDKKSYTYPLETPVCSLDCSEAFKSLTTTEKKYAHFLSKASFDGSLITFCQVSVESPAIFILIYRLFSAESIDSLKAKALTLEWTENEFSAFLVYCAAFYSNGGNYKGFGDSKIIPDVDKEKLRKLLEHSNAASREKGFINLYDMIEERMFSLKLGFLNLGLPPQGVTTYHSSNVTKEDTDLVSRYLKSHQKEGWNSRLIKQSENDKNVYRIRLASIDCEPKELSKEEFEGAIIITERCDYGPLMLRTTDWLKKALPFVANKNQREMLSQYIRHFETGDLKYHKDGSRAWIRDVGPSVESYIGFIENYRDPVGVRSEFEGFVAAVNKETSKKLGELVNQAENLLERLPWDRGYEKDKFLKPDFTSLDVISFGGSGIPCGINIPNYDEIRQNEGFKNVSLGNVISAIPKTKITFLKEIDEELYREYQKHSFTVQVGLHELLGHGSGKLLQRNIDGTFNFDRNLKDMLTGNAVTSWYEPGETWSSKFGFLSSAYEECRAEAVGYFLSCSSDILKIFGYEGEMADTVKYINWLSGLRSGLVGLEFYSPETMKWGQAHCFARYTILRVCLDAGQGFVAIKETTGEDGKPDLLLTLDRTKIDSVGKPAVGAFLRKLQAYKSTADFDGGSVFFNYMGRVEKRDLKWREIVIDRRQPRRLFVQGNTQLDSAGEVTLKTYPETVEGIIDSIVDRYTPDAVTDLENVWRRDSPIFGL
ncbi:hypothetical protein AB6A40_005074 [Gnathostoma spinigerum]|uniref:Dipeptidyl peptidase 3 n=1 Tax=Gnathostoma spinigerum TaxID=75299 RepID=A0ABD6EED6_9BILA